AVAHQANPAPSTSCSASNEAGNTGCSPPTEPSRARTAYPSAPAATRTPPPTAFSDRPSPSTAGTNSPRGPARTREDREDPARTGARNSGWAQCVTLPKPTPNDEPKPQKDENPATSGFSRKI